MDGHRQASKHPLALPLSCAISAVPPLGPRGTGGVYPQTWSTLDVVTEVEELNLAGESSADDSESPVLYRCYFRAIRPSSYGCFVSWR